MSHPDPTKEYVDDYNSNYPYGTKYHLANKVLLGDWVEHINDIPDESVQLILTDPPYGTTPANWDEKIDVSLLWSHFRRILKPNGAIVIFGQQPFTSKLISSNTEEYKYN